MFTKATILATSVSFLAGIYYQRNEKRYGVMYDDLLKMPLIQFNQLKNVSEIPEGFIMLQGHTDPDNFCKKGHLNPNKKVIVSSLAQIIDNEKNVMWKLKQSAFSFNIKNPQGFKMSIQNTQHSEIILFNLNKITKNISPSELPFLRLNFYQQLLNTMGKLKFAECAIIPEEQYIFIGKVAKQGQEYVMRPRIILGSEKEQFIMYLNNYLINNNKRGKICIASSIGIFGFYLLLTKVLFQDYFQNRRRIVVKEEQQRN